jgi:superfamily II DNA/RNA helicase
VVVSQDKDSQESVFSNISFSLHTSLLSGFMPLTNTGGNGFSRPYRNNNFNRNRPQGGGANRSGGFGGNRGGGRGGFKNRFKKSDWSQMDIIKSIEMAAIDTAAKVDIPEEIYTPQNNFEDFNISRQLKQNIITKGYKAPSPIQDQAIPAILEGKDLIGIANTGTGKTAAFLIPLIDKVSKSNTEKVLIVTPTRELAEQIDNEFRDFTKGLGLFSTLCIGGKNMHTQIAQLRRSSTFVIGTPGRLRDLIKRHVLDLSKFNNVVLDETDRMVDIGFIEEIKYFISLLPKQRQSLFFSATLAPKIRDILQTFVADPVTVSVKKQEINVNITQELVRVPHGKTKVDHLHELLAKQDFLKVLVFANTKWGVQKLADELVKRGFNAGAIHGNKSQGQRQAVLSKFKTNRIKILVATDVAARGLDIDNVSHVINYELPDAKEDYTHRIGRTGRANRKGIALTFVD